MWSELFDLVALGLLELFIPARSPLSCIDVVIKILRTMWDLPAHSWCMESDFPCWWITRVLGNRLISFWLVFDVYGYMLLAFNTVNLISIVFRFATCHAQFYIGIPMILNKVFNFGYWAHGSLWTDWYKSGLFQCIDTRNAILLGEVWKEGEEEGSGREQGFLYCGILPDMGGTYRSNRGPI